MLLTAGASERELSPMLEGLNRKIFGSLDIERHTRELGQLLESRAYPSLELTTSIVPGETHFTMPYAAIAGGLRHVFR